MQPTRILFAILALGLSIPTPAQLITQKGLADYQVLQRDRKNLGQATFAGKTTYPGKGKIEARVLPTGQVGVIVPWKVCGEAKNGSFQANIKALPMGGPYNIELRLLTPGGKVVDQGRHRQILVGDLWFLAGQSNMEGCGILKRGAVKPSPLVHVFDLADRWLVAKEPLHWKIESVDIVQSGKPGPKRDKQIKQNRIHRWRGSGLGLPFGREMVRHTGVPVGLLTCALGGTKIDQWSPARRDEGGKSLYGAMYRRFLACGGRVRGVLWHQGESDCFEDLTPTYATKFIALVAAIRRDFGQPQLPFYYAQIGRYQFVEREKWWVILRNEQLRCETIIPPPTGMVSTIDLPLVDAIHIATSSLIEVGRRMALLASRDLLGKKEITTGPRPVKIESFGGYPQRVIITFAGANGGLKSPGRLSGFSIRDKDGKDLRIIINQFINPKRRDQVILECQVTWRFAKLPAGAFIHYGYGNDPYCNLMDDQNLATPGFFRPLPLPPK